MILSFIIYLFYLKEFNFFNNKNFLYLLALFLYLIFNSLISLDVMEGFIRNFGFIRIIILFIAINFFFKNRSFLKKVIFAWFITVSIVIFDVYFEFIFGANIFGWGAMEIDGVAQSHANRVLSFFKDEPIVGGYLNAFLLIIIGYLFNFKISNKEFITILICLIFIISIFLTGERSNSVRAIFGITMFFILMPKLNLKKKIIGLISGFILISILIIS